MNGTRLDEKLSWLLLTVTASHLCDNIKEDNDSLVGSEADW